MDKPLLSICIPTYNRADIVYECVQDCLKIPHDWIEVVVTDNCSTDDTGERLSRIKDSRLKYFRNEKNIGYVNLSKCMTNGSGEYSLLLCDEDIFVDTDWEALKKELEEAKGAALFQFKFLDEKGNILIAPPEKVFEKGQYDTLTKVYRSFAYSGAAIIRTDLAKTFWKKDKRVPVIWSLYSEIIVPLYCALHGDYKAICSVTVQRSSRSNTGTLDTTAWCGTMKDPYWSIESRRQQYLDWIRFFANFDVEDNLRLQLAENVVLDSIRAYRNYYSIISVDSEAPLFAKYRELIIRDRKRYEGKWIQATKRLYDQISSEFDNTFGPGKRTKMKECLQLARVIASFGKQSLRKFLKHYL